eukprot:Transcript_11868.p1 GENE.Transcript_11868~~Transcript_11868.p1  ORF type:complete len:586 (-),score=236.49 Transcript_11868:55-1812(-)
MLSVLTIELAIALLGLATLVFLMTKATATASYGPLGSPPASWQVGTSDGVPTWDHAKLLKRLAELSAPPPEAAPTRPKKGAGFADLVRATFRRPAECEPSSWPLLVAAGFLLRHWLAPPLVVGVPLACAAWPPSPLSLAAWFVLWLAALTHSLGFNWQLRRSLWDQGAVKAGVYTPAGPRGDWVGARLRKLHASLRLTPWCWHGDLHTLFPFIFYKALKVPYTRFWLHAPAAGDRGGPEGEGPRKPMPASTEERELLAIDWAFPWGGHNPVLPLAIVLHGLNGGSAEPLTSDFVAAATRRGWTCAVLNARGLGGTELSSGVPFHGARTSDLAALVRLVAAAAPGVRLVGVGYSMGAIILANYLGVAGADCPLLAAVAISGCFDGAANFTKNSYGPRGFEPFLSYELKQNFCTGPRGQLLEAGGVDLSAAKGPKVSSIADFDAQTVVRYFGFEGLEDYYNHLSLGSLGKLGRVAVPLLSLHALDDPIVNSCTFAPYVEFAQRRQPKTPSDVQHHDDGEAAASSSNLFFLFTRRGGHVGWCEGWNPRWAGPDGAWGFQNRAVFEFVDAVLGYPCRSAAVAAGYKPRE